MRGSQSHGCRPLTTSSAQVLSKHQLVMMHFILWYSTTFLVKKPWSWCQEATWKSHETCAGAEPKDHGQPQHGNVSKFAVSTCMS